MQDALSIGRLADRAGLAPSAIRYYESIGLMPEPYRVSGQRRYGDDALARLEFIASAQRAGFTLREIVALSDDFALAAIARSKLPEVREQLKRTREIERWLDAASDCDCQSADECTLFEGETALQLVHVNGCRRQS